VIAALQAAGKAIAATPPSKEPAHPPPAPACSQVLTASAEATSPEDRDAARAEGLGSYGHHPQRLSVHESGGSLGGGNSK
jgi:hypothetical protein